MKLLMIFVMIEMKGNLKTRVRGCMFQLSSFYIFIFVLYENYNFLSNFFSEANIWFIYECLFSLHEIFN